VGGLLFLGNKGVTLPRINQRRQAEEEDEEEDSYCFHSIETMLTAFVTGLLDITANVLILFPLSCSFWKTFYFKFKMSLKNLKYFSKKYQKL
jgi:hypothetical protein